MQLKLTERRVAQLEPQEDQYLVYDVNNEGFGVLVNPGGSKSYFYQGRIGGVGEPKRRKLGTPKTLTLQQAIDKAKDYAELFRSGVDPKRLQAEQVAKNQDYTKKSKREQMTFGEAMAVYIEARSPTNDLSDKQKRWSKNTLLDHKKACRPYLVDDPTKKYKKAPFAALWHYPLSELTPEVIKEWIKEESKTRPTKAGQAHRMYRAFVNWCEEDKRYENLIPDKSATAKAVKSEVQQSRSSKTSLQRQQLATWFNLVFEHVPSPAHAAVLQCILLNGSRPQEMMSLKWSDVDFRWDTITIIDKVDQWERVIPLTPYVKKLMLDLPRVNEYVFGSLRSAEGYVVRSPTYEEAIRKSSLPNITPKALRKSFSTLSEWLALPDGIESQIIGHRPSATAEKHYKDRSIDLLRFWHMKIELFILREAKIDTTGLYSDTEQIPEITNLP